VQKILLPDEKRASLFFRNFRLDLNLVDSVELAPAVGSFACGLTSTFMGKSLKLQFRWLLTSAQAAEGFSE
jgi:hypothetical protein